MLLRVEQGKVHKYRNAMPSPQLFDLLRLWWRAGKWSSVSLSYGWLFAGSSDTDPVSTRELHRIVQEAAEAAGIRAYCMTVLGLTCSSRMSISPDPGAVSCCKIDMTALYAKVATRTIHAFTGPFEK
jgi:integrase/recombinase XerD